MNFAIVIKVDDDYEDDVHCDGRELRRGHVLIRVVIPYLWRMEHC